VRKNGENENKIEKKKTEVKYYKQTFFFALLPFTNICLFINRKQIKPLEFENFHKKI